MTLLKILALIVLPGLALAGAWMIRDAVRNRNGTGILLLSGLALLFLGERMFGEGDWRLPVSGTALVLIGAAAALRVHALSGSEGARREAHLKALWAAALVGAGLVLYAATLDMTVDSLGFDEEGATRWRGAWSALFPIVLALGVGPMLMLDRVLAVHPVALPAGAAQRAVYSGMSLALAVALAFPLNYLSNAHTAEWDVAYFRTAKPGESTLALARTLVEPVEVTLFFASGSDVRQEVEPYFREVQKASGGMLQLEVVDQALDPTSAEELKVRDNGHIAFRSGESTEKFKVGTDLDRAKRELKKLDSTVQKHLIKVTRGERTVYMLTGHGEASQRERDDPLRKLGIFTRSVLEAQNLKVSDFGVPEGSSNKVPDDAGVVIVAAPEKPLLPEEERTLKKFWDDGGRLLVLLDPETDPLHGLLDHLGVQRGEGVLAHGENYIRQKRGPADRVLLVSNKFGSHASIKTLSRNSTQLALILPTVVSVAKTADTDHKVQTLVRTFPDTWVDANDNREPDEGEDRKVFEVAVAVTPAEGEARAIVVGDVSLLSDPVLSVSKGNALFGYDAVRWLLGDEEIAGEVTSEEDVKIVHTRNEDQYWFWATTGAVPLFILGLGAVLVQIRRRKA